VGGATELHDHEFDEVRWFQLEEALEVMTHATERDVVQRASVRLAERGEAAAREPGQVAGEGARS